MNIKLLPIKKKMDELIQIAKWRNQTLKTLRSSFSTKVDYSSQCIWVDSIRKDHYFFIYNEMNHFIGYCGLSNINIINKTAELSLLIGTEYQGKGYGHEAVQKLLQYGFIDLELNCIFIEVYTTSDNWKNFWSKTGFIHEGLLRQRKLWKGELYDSIIASVLNSEWKKNMNYSGYKIL